MTTRQACEQLMQKSRVIELDYFSGNEQKYGENKVGISMTFNTTVKRGLWIWTEFVFRKSTFIVSCVLRTPRLAAQQRQSFRELAEQLKIWQAKENRVTAV